MNKLYIIIIIIVVILLSIFISQKYLKKSESFQNFQLKQPLYILWTGGYDSTFRICQALIDEKKIVQPIYISDIIDNLPKNINERRHSQKNEYQAMEKIRKEIYKSFPYTQKTFLPLIDIKKINIDQNIQYHMNILKKQKRVRRSTCQYGAIAQLCKNMNQNINTKKYIEISVEKEPHGSIMYNTIHKKVNCIQNKCYLKNNLAIEDQSLKIFKYLIFSTLNYTKKDMLNISEKGGYKHIMQLTWSCWYPKNNKPCGRCIMCRERII